MSATQLPSALAYFGTPESVSSRLVEAINKAREEKNFSDQELADSIALESTEAIKALNNPEIGIFGLQSSELLSLMSQLGLDLEMLMPFDADFSRSEQEEWENVRVRSGAGPVYASALGAKLDAELVTSLFLRFEALEELFASHNQA